MLVNLKMDFKMDMVSFLGRMAPFIEETLRMALGKGKANIITLKIVP